MVSAGADGAVQFHNVVTGEPAGILRAGDGIVNAISLSPDGTLVAGGYETGAVTVWEVATSRYQTLLGHAGHVNDVAFSPQQPRPRLRGQGRQRPPLALRIPGKRFAVDGVLVECDFAAL